MKKASKSSPAAPMSADAQGHIRAEAVRHFELTGEVIADVEALEKIVSQHAELHRLVADYVVHSFPAVDSVGALFYALDGGALHLIEANEDTNFVQFRNGVLAALQDPKTSQSVAALRSRIGQLGIDMGWWKVNATPTEAPQ